jgi:hypothetical protein
LAQDIEFGRSGRTLRIHWSGHGNAE